MVTAALPTRGGGWNPAYRTSSGFTVVVLTENSNKPACFRDSGLKPGWLKLSQENRLGEKSFTSFASPYILIAFIFKNTNKIK